MKILKYVMSPTPSNNQIQKVVFSTFGNFALHKITGDFSGRCSAWFKKDGEIIDAEQILPNGTSRNVIKYGPIWRKCEEFGKIYVNY
jgi:hypothetical protein